MKILIYCGHPAQYHFFRNTISILRSKNHEVELLIKTKDVLEDLLKYYKEEYTNILPSGRRDSRMGILFGLLKREIRLFKHMRKFRPDIVLGTDPALAHISRLLKIPCITCLEDDYEVIPQLAKITYPFTKHIFTPYVCHVGKYEAKKIGYDGYMKLAYLHPRYFHPDRNIVAPFTERRFFLIRMAKLSAYHDLNILGLSKKLLTEIIKKLERHGKIFISSEFSVDTEFQKYLLDIHPVHIHHFIYYADLLISDSQSMSVEAAILGTPSIRISDFTGRISVLEELEHKYRLTFGIQPAQLSQSSGILLEQPTQSSKIIEKIDDLLNQKDLKEVWKTRRHQMLDDKIDVTALLVNLIENYPASL